jgi:hypothetical protein
MDWIQHHVPIALPFACIILIVAGQAYFAKKERCRWRYTLAAWNRPFSLFLAPAWRTSSAPVGAQSVDHVSRDNLCLDPRSTEVG